MHSRLRTRVCIFLLLLLVGSAAAPGADFRDLKPTVILVCIDAFRYDYFGKAKTPNLDGLIARGVKARYLVPSFPTKTFPNHYTLVTGLYPAHHGIVGNSMWDDDLNAMFKMANRKQVQDPRWWGGEPIWVTAEKAGQKTAAFYWPGSEAAIEGIRPDYWEAWDDQHRTPLEYRVHKVLSWLDLPLAERPTFLTLYFETVDDAGHDYGPDSPELVKAVERVDHMIGLLLQGLKARGIEDKVNIVVASDHGMAASSRERLIMLDDYVDVRNLLVTDFSPVLAVRAKNGDNAALLAKLKRVPHVTVYTRETMPARLHYSGNKRIMPITVVADVGWTITTHEYVATHPDRKYGGDHGYDNAAKEMRGIFLAAGPAFKPHATLPAFPNVDVYSLLAYLLNVTPAKNDGSLKVFKPVLRPKAQPDSIAHHILMPEPRHSVIPVR